MNKEMELIKKEPNESSGDKNYITVMYMINSTGNLTSRFEVAEERTRKLEVRLIEVMKCERRQK